MDGLLVDSEPFWREAEKKVFSTVHISLTDDMCKETMGLRIDEVVDYWMNRHPWDVKSKEQLIQEIIEEMQHLLSTESELLPGIQESFLLFQSLGLKMAIASSSYQVLIDAVMEKFDLNNTLEFGYSAEHEAYGKPHPGVFISASKKLNIPAQQCLVLEDSFLGVVAALAASMKVIAIPDEEQQVDPRFQIADAVLSSAHDLHGAILNFTV